MLNEICAYLNNYGEIDKLFGDYEISNGRIRYADGREIPVKSGGYIRVYGSDFNDGIYRVFDDTPIDFKQDEAFNGAVWRLRFEPDFISLCDDIKAWCDKHMPIDSPLMSPFNSENFAGYGYTKATPVGSQDYSWRNAFKSRLSKYRKPRI